MSCYQFCFFLNIFLVMEYCIQTLRQNLHRLTCQLLKSLSILCVIFKQIYLLFNENKVTKFYVCNKFSHFSFEIFLLDFSHRKTIFTRLESSYFRACNQQEKAFSRLEKFYFSYSCDCSAFGSWHKLHISSKGLDKLEIHEQWNLLRFVGTITNRDGRKKVHR